MERVEHVLPGTHRLRVAQHYRLRAVERAQDVRHEAVDSPVAAADHVAGPRRSDPAFEVACGDRRPRRAPRAAFELL